MNYISRYGLEFNPFEKNSKEILVEDQDYRELKFRLDYLLQLKGFGLVTGSPGLGKTTILRNWTKGLNPSAYRIVYLSLSTVTTQEFYRQLCAALGADERFRKVDNYKEIQSAIRRMSIEKKITPVIIFDEAQYMKTQILSDLKILFNFDMDASDKAIIILCGLPLLISTLSLNANEALRQRIIMSYQLSPLNKEESRSYIDTKLKKAGCMNQIFEENAYEAIVDYCSGNPRNISRLCDKALLLGDNLKENLISADTVMKAIEEVERYGNDKKVRQSAQALSLSALDVLGEAYETKAAALEGKDKFKQSLTEGANLADMLREEVDRLTMAVNKANKENSFFGRLTKTLNDIVNEG